MMRQYNMNEYYIELKLYEDCLYELKRRIGVIADHLNRVTIEKYLIVEVETVCLQFRKILEKIALMSLVANKEAYAEQNAKFAQHYHAERIMRDLKRINPDFYPAPIKLIQQEDKMPEWVKVEEGFLTKEEFVNIYQKCGGMMHAQNPFAGEKPIREIQECFPEWLAKISVLLNHHQITLVGGNLRVVGLMQPKNGDYPQAVLFEKRGE